MCRCCSPHAPSIEGAEKHGYTYTSGPLLFDQLASELAAADVEISSASARRLYSAFQRGHRANESVDSSGLDPLYVLEPLKTCNTPARPHEFIASRVTIDHSTGRCPRSGARLRLIDLDSDQKKQLQEGLIALATTNFLEFRKHSKSDKAADSIKQFGEWLE
jgi:hypothetical protein